MVAALFLAEAAHPPQQSADQAKWRRRWFPGRAGRAPGPIGIPLPFHQHDPELRWRFPDTPAG